VCDTCRSRCVLHARIDSLIDILRPNEESERVRESTVKWVEKHLNVPIRTVGSYPLRTYLPCSDIDLLVLENRHKWYSRICSNVIEEASKKMSKIRSLEFVNGNTMGVVRFVSNNVTVDITCFSDSMGNPMKSIVMLEKYANKIGQDDLFKRSLILLKAWLRYETDAFGARRGGLCTYALNIMVVHIFETFGEYCKHPLDVLAYFMSHYSSFSWDRKCVSAFQGSPSIETSIESGEKRAINILDPIRENKYSCSRSLSSSKATHFISSMRDAWKGLTQVMRFGSCGEYHHHHQGEIDTKGNSGGRRTLSLSSLFFFFSFSLLFSSHSLSLCLSLSHTANEREVEKEILWMSRRNYVF